MKRDESAIHQARIRMVLSDCEVFEVVLRKIIRDPKYVSPTDSSIAHAAAECLFAVRKMENAITAKTGTRLSIKEEL